MTHRDAINRTHMHLKQLMQITGALQKDLLSLTSLVDDLAYENGRLRVALMRAERYNESFPRDDSGVHTCVQLPSD